MDIESAKAKTAPCRLTRFIGSTCTRGERE
jgi:hypothetical protein